MPALTYTFWKAVTSDPGFIPHQPKDSHDLKVKMDYSNYLIVGASKGLNLSFSRLQYCGICNIYRPKRAAHCEKCNACVL
jgi:hypothetical protein